jgi:hypothetical protein
MPAINMFEILLELLMLVDFAFDGTIKTSSFRFEYSLNISLVFSLFLLFLCLLIFLMPFGFVLFFQGFLFVKNISSFYLL